MGVERTQNTDNTDNDHTERGVLEYLNTRATVELSKLRAAFKYTHDQATGVVSETTMPAATAPPTYVKSVFIVHVGGTRYVTSRTDQIMKIHARIILTVEFIRGYIFKFLFYV